MRWHPKCFDSVQQYNRWRSVNTEKVYICTDCTPEYQTEMIRAYRCKHPQAQFRLDKDGMMEGWVPVKIRRAA